MIAKFRKITVLTILVFALLLIVKCTKDDDTIDNPQEESGTFTDARDNNTYSWIKIGNQTWMAENLAYQASSNCVAYNNNENNVSIYGYLYSWETAQVVAPDGWHLPSQAEWQTLVDYLGGRDEAYDKLLEKGISHWESPNTGTNEGKFTALPSGYYDQRDNTFNFLGHLTMFHSTTESSSNPTIAFGLILNPNYKGSLIEGRPKKLWLPVRCVKN